MRAPNHSTNAVPTATITSTNGESLGKNILAESEQVCDIQVATGEGVSCPWLNSHRPVSLFEMIPILSSIITDIVEGIKRVSQQLQEAQKARGVESQLTTEEASTILDWVLKIRAVLEACEFETAAIATYGVTEALKRGCTLGEMGSEIERLGWTLGIDSNKKLFLYVTKEEAKYYEQDALFGEAVNQTFQSAKADIRQAGTCLASGLYTACVFHLMRVAEWGLRNLAKRLRVRIKDKGKVCPIEYGDWDKIITAVKNKIADVRRIPSGPKRQAKLEYYSDAADHCTFMKDIWRNTASHARKPYSRDEALAVYGRVKEFMQFLARTITVAGLGPQIP